MNAIALGSLLADPAQAGAFFVDERDCEAMLAAAHGLDYAVARIDLADCRAKPCVLALISTALEFPDWVGDNWDALADALNDLSWRPAGGYLLLLENAAGLREQDPEDFEVLVDVLQQAATGWAAQRTAFWTLIPLPGNAMGALPG